VYAGNGGRLVAFSILGSTWHVAKPDLHKVLRDELKARGWGTRDLATRLEVRFGVVARWVTEDESGRVVPLPGMCVQLARVLDLDVIDVFRHAGYLPPMAEDEDPNKPDIEMFLHRLQRMLRNKSNEEWIFARDMTALSLDHLQLTLEHGTSLLERKHIS
jgi:hypothetical protein